MNLLHLIAVFCTLLTTHYYLMGAVFYKRMVILWKKCGLTPNFSYFHDWSLHGKAVQ